jgi:vancomycin permeability regulator SanA
MTPRRALRIALRVLLGLVALTVVYLAVVFVQVWMAARRDDARASDGIVVLGAAQFDGRPSRILAARLDHAIDLYNDGYAPMVVVTGGNQPGDRFTEADTGARYLADHGVPASAIQRETTGRSSWQSLSSAAASLKEQHKTKVVLVSDPYHAARIEDIAHEVGLDAVTSPTRTSPIKGAGEWRRFFTETIRVAAGRIFGYGRLDRHREVGKLVPGLATLCPPLTRPRRRRGSPASGATFGGGVIGNTTGSGPVIGGSSPPPRARR